MMGPKDHPLVLLRWNDAHSPAATQTVSVDDLHNVHKTIPITTCGWVLRDDHDGVTIAGEYCDDGDYRNVTFVPRAIIETMTPLSHPRKRPTKAISPGFDEGLTSHG